MIIPESKLNALIQGYEDLYKSNEQLKKYAETDLPKRIDYVKGKYKEVVRDYNDLADRFNNNLEKIDSLEKENKSLKTKLRAFTEVLISLWKIPLVQLLDKLKSS